MTDHDRIVESMTYLASKGLLTADRRVWKFYTLRKRSSHSGNARQFHRHQLIRSIKMPPEPDYRQSAVTGQRWRRALHVECDNGFGQTP